MVRCSELTIKTLGSCLKFVQHNNNNTKTMFKISSGLTNKILEQREKFVPSQQ